MVLSTNKVLQITSKSRQTTDTKKFTLEIDKKYNNKDIIAEYSVKYFVVIQ